MPFEISFLWTVVKDVYDNLGDRKKNTIEALSAVRRAFNYTYDYLVNNQGKYVPNMHLADLWNEASTKVMMVDRSWGDLLASKSRFWAHPHIYQALNRTVDVPTLKQITDEMEHLRQRIR